MQAHGFKFIESLDCKLIIPTGSRMIYFYFAHQLCRTSSVFVFKLATSSHRNTKSYPTIILLQIQFKKT